MHRWVISCAVACVVAASAQTTNTIPLANGGLATSWTGHDGTVPATGDGTVLAAGDSTVVASSTAGTAAQSARPAQLPNLLQALAPQALPPGEWHMKPVRAIHARVQSDAPMLHPTTQLFVSRLGQDDFEAGYMAGMDGVNTASVEGALMYVQAEGINYNTRADEQRCERKNKMKYIVFYEVVVAQTNETLALYQDTADQNEYGPMVPLDQGRCSPTGTRAGKDVLPKECYYFNGDQGEPNVGPFVGGESKAQDVRAPYPDNLWFSLPNTCPLQVWANKTPACRAATRQGLCDFGVLPDGVHCTFAYAILGFLPIDDIVGITSMASNRTGQLYKDFAEFCEDGGVEFRATQEGEWQESIAFWQDPQDEEANAARARHAVALYQNLTSGIGASTLVDPSVVPYMRPLPTVEEMARENPPCYENVKKCSATACRRETFSQVCRECDASGETSAGCGSAPRDFAFPELKKAVGDNGNEGDADPRVQGGGSGGESGRTKPKAAKTSGASERFFPLAMVSLASTLTVTWTVSAL